MLDEIAPNLSGSVKALAEHPDRCFSENCSLLKMWRVVGLQLHSRWQLASEGSEIHSFPAFVVVLLGYRGG